MGCQRRCLQRGDALVPLHVVAIGTGGGAFHTIRSGPPTPGWTTWVSLPPLPAPVDRIDSALVAGELHVCAATAAGTLLHTFRNTAGTWQSFWGDAGNAAGLPSATFEFRYIGMAGVGTTLHVCSTANRRRAGGGLMPAFVWPIFHATRSTGVGATWTSPFTEVNPGQFPAPSTVFTEVSCANVAGTVHLCALGFFGNELWHTIQLSPPPTESWQPYNNVKLAHTNSPGSVGTVSVKGLGSNLHVCVVSAGGIFHTIRMSVPPSWQNPEGSGSATWGNVTAEVPGLTLGSQNFVDCAAADGNLHVCCLTASGVLFHTIRTSTPPPSWQNPEGSGSATWGNVGAVVGALPGGTNPAPFSLVTTAGA